MHYEELSDFSDKNFTLSKQISYPFMLLTVVRIAKAHRLESSCIVLSIPMMQNNQAANHHILQKSSKVVPHTSKFRLDESHEENKLG